jgi:hypothetical protein
MTKITSKQFKVIETVDFNGNAIENALINAMANTITGLQTSNVENLDFVLDGITNSILDVNEKVDGLSNIVSVNVNELYNEINSLQPQVVANSGSSLPSVLGYNFGDKFLNTTDKKIYTVISNAYELNEGVSNNITVDFQTGIASNFHTEGSMPTYSYGIAKTNASLGWVGENKTWNIHFKINSLDNNMCICTDTTHTTNELGTTYYTFFGIKNKQITVKLGSKYYSAGSITIKSETVLLDTELEVNKEYYLRITKNNNIVESSLSHMGYDINPIEIKETTTEDNYGPKISSFGYNLEYSSTGMNKSGYRLLDGQIYLLDSFGEFLKPATSSFLWDSGILVTDLTKYADVTNEIIYYYINGILFSSVNSFAQITGQPTDNNALNITLSGITNTLLTKQDVLVSGTNIKTINDNSVLGNGNLAITTYQAFPNSWPTNTTFTALIEAIKNDTTAVKGMAYLGELTCSELPSGLSNVEAVIEIMNGTTAQNKVIHTTLTSSNIEPYRWEYTYWSGNQQVNWIGFDYNREIKTLNTTTPTTNVYLDANNTYTLNCGDQVTSLNISLLEPDNESINNSILLHSYVGLTNIQISWGTDKFFNNETPTIDSMGYYDIVYVWNNLLNKYICNVTFISEN